MRLLRRCIPQPLLEKGDSTLRRKAEDFSFFPKGAGECTPLAPGVTSAKEEGEKRAADVRGSGYLDRLGVTPKTVPVSPHVVSDVDFASRPAYHSCRHRPAAPNNPRDLNPLTTFA